ncbi:MAG: hypothetical protein GF364_22180 [Candidatus Lokiarchaeota archaeon]|nr:hypothetical protein [Candidatus Lokiarchaeota archaeon]
MNWKKEFSIDSTRKLLNSKDKGIIYFTKRDLLDEDVKPIPYIWNLSEPQKIIKRQLDNGSWRAPRRQNKSDQNYQLIETWKKIRFLIEKYQMDKSLSSIQKAAEYIFSCQTSDGDIRGILTNQYAPYYTGAIIYLLIKAGYGRDPRTEKAIKWLLTMRQDDGGWVIGSPPLVCNHELSRKEKNEFLTNKEKETLKEFDRSLPFSAAGTGMVLRAFSVHPIYKDSKETRIAANLLKSKMFKKDNWSSYQHPDNWIRFQFPFWWTNLVSVLDTFSLLKWSQRDPDISKGLKWFKDHQMQDGLWDISYSKIHKNRKNKKTETLRYWITLVICRIFKRFYERE